MDAECIWCHKVTQMTLEHIVPESLGGNITIESVCRTCADRIGSSVDGRFINQFFIELPRFNYGVEGKRGHIPNPFGKGGQTVDGKKVQLDPNLKPYFIPNITESVEENGAKRISIEIDATDEPHIEQILTKKIIRTLKDLHPDWSDDQLKNETKNLVEQAKHKITRKSSEPIINYSFAFDLNTMILAYSKIAYEMAFQVFGYDYVKECKTAEILRDAVFSSTVKERTIQGSMLDDSMNWLFVDPDKHYILMLENVCWIKLFRFNGAINFNNTDAKYRLSEDNALIYILDFKNSTYEKKTLFDYVNDTFN